MIDHRKIFEAQIKILSQRSISTIVLYQILFFKTPILSANNIGFRTELVRNAPTVNKSLKAIKAKFKHLIRYKKVPQHKKELKCKLSYALIIRFSILKEKILTNLLGYLGIKRLILSERAN